MDVYDDDDDEDEDEDEVAAMRALLGGAADDIEEGAVGAGVGGLTVPGAPVVSLPSLELFRRQLAPRRAGGGGSGPAAVAPHQRDVSSGADGGPWLAFHHPSRQYVVVERWRRQSSAAPTDQQSLRAWASLPYSPRLTRLLGLAESRPGAGDAADNKVYTVSSWCAGGQLIRLLDEEGRLPTRSAAFCIVQVTLGLASMHRAGVVYRNLRPENVLLDRKGHCKLARFELAKRLGGSGSGIGVAAVGPRTFTVCAGKLGNLAPEQVLHLGHGRAVDLWALGVLLFELLTGTAPFEPLSSATASTSLSSQAVVGSDGLAVLHRIVEGRYNVKAASEAKHYTVDAADLVRRLLCVDPIRRLGGGGGSATDVLGHKWLQSPSTIDVAAVRAQRCPPPWKVRPVTPPPPGSGERMTKVGDLAAVLDDDGDDDSDDDNGGGNGYGDF